MATKAWVTAAAASYSQLLAPRSFSPAQPVSPAHRSAARGLRLLSRLPRPAKFVCRRAKNAGYEDYKFPDPIPEFAEQETSKFREHMAWRLEQKKEDYFGEHVEEIVDICTEVTEVTSLQMAPPTQIQVTPWCECDEGQPLTRSTPVQAAKGSCSESTRWTWSRRFEDRAIRVNVGAMEAEGWVGHLVVQVDTIQRA